MVFRLFQDVAPPKSFRSPRATGGPRPAAEARRETAGGLPAAELQHALEPPRPEGLLGLVLGLDEPVREEEERVLPAEKDRPLIVATPLVEGRRPGGGG